MTFFISRHSALSVGEIQFAPDRGLDTDQHAEAVLILRSYYPDLDVHALTTIGVSSDEALDDPALGLGVDYHALPEPVADEPAEDAPAKKSTKKST